jgi:ubiquinone biosynthesis protein UbiJ
MAGSHPLLAGVLAGTLETAIGRYLALAPRRRELLEPIAGKLIALRLRPFGATLYLCPTETRVQVLTEAAGEPDVILSGYLGAFAALGLGGSAERRLFAGDIEIEGDADTARRFQALFERLDIDWQAHLARYTGEGIAAACLDLIRSGTAWTRDTADTLRTNLAEFWQEETRELPAHPEADAFFTEVDRLRADHDRLEARIKRLEATLASPALDRST